ncbi:MAG: hypothetical protein ACOC2H_01125, partial [Spirochaetota bacterium]
MICKKYQDPNGSQSFIDRIHLVFCPRCARSVRAEKKLLEKTISSSPYRTSVQKDVFMKRIPHWNHRKPQQSVSDVTWLFCGIFLLSGGIILPFSGGYDWAQIMFGSRYEIVTFMTFGILITVYA